MHSLGILLYGYCQDDASAIKKVLGAALGEELVLLTASRMEDRKLSDILGSSSKTFEEQDTKILLLLGFNDEQLQTALRSFPKEISRPIFCTLTQENINWTFAHLLEHLKEEEAYWKNRKADGN